MLQKVQQIQEDEYHLPYHWWMDRESFGGRIYFGYIDICTSLLSKKIDINENTKVLDAGCGDGRFIAELQKKGITHLYGVDYSNRAISFARILVPNANFSVSDISELPYNDNFFDCIFLVEVLEHIDPKEIQRLILSLKRVLKCGGQLIITTPSKNTPPPNKHFQHFSEESISAILKPHFDILEIQGQGYVNFSILNFLYKILDNRFWLLRKIARFYNLCIWPKYFNKCDTSEGERLIVRCLKQ